LRLRLRGQACECRVARPLARADAQLHALANVDTWLSQIDRAIAEMTKRGRTNGVLPPSTRGARPVVIWSLSASGKRASHWLEDWAGSRCRQGSCDRGRGGPDHVRGAVARGHDGASHTVADFGDGAVAVIRLPLRWPRRPRPGSEACDKMNHRKPADRLFMRRAARACHGRHCFTRKSFQRPSPVHSRTYVESFAGQVQP